MSSSSLFVNDPRKILVIDNIGLLEYKHSSTRKYTPSILSEVYVKENGIEFLKVENYNGDIEIIPVDLRNPITFMFMENINNECKVIHVPK